MYSSLKLKDHFKENKLFVDRTIAAAIIVSLFLLSLAGRLIYLQIIQHELFSNQALSNKARSIILPSPRGVIYARGGEIIADNYPQYSLELNVRQSRKVEQVLNRLNKVIPISKEERQIFKKQLKYKGIMDTVPLKSKLSEEEVALFSLHKYQFPELDVVARLNRTYPHGEIFAHVLGFIGIISEQELKTMDPQKYRGNFYVGKSGIEKTYEHLLHGDPGYDHVETDAKGRIIKVLDTDHAKPGQNLNLTIDLGLQKLAYQALGDNRGAVVAIEPKTGKILAMVSKPSFNPNEFVVGLDNKKISNLQKDPARPLFNRAITGQYPPGSTVKPILALKGLQSRFIQADETIHDPGYFQLPDDSKVFHDWKENGHGFIKLERAIAESCTTYFYILANRMGIENIHDAMAKFGLGAPTGVGLPAESSGIAPSSKWKRAALGKPWYPGETLNVGIGQGYSLVTPMQMAQVAAIIANRGEKVEPVLIEGQEPLRTKIEFDDRHWRTIISGMRQVVDSPAGTAGYIGGSHLEIAGKTGTAQVFSLKEDEKYDASKLKEELKDHAWFIAFAPANDPKIAMAVILENSKGASKVSKKLIEYYLKR